MGAGYDAAPGTGVPPPAGPQPLSAARKAPAAPFCAETALIENSTRRAYTRLFHSVSGPLSTHEKATYAVGIARSLKETTVSTPLNRLSPLPVRERAACMCQHGGRCSSFAPGHALHLIQARIASATPSEWIDGIVEWADAGNGDLVVRGLDGAAHALWNASGASLEATPGTPVALHARYGVLAIGRTQYNVAAA